MARRHQSSRHQKLDQTAAILAKLAMPLGQVWAAWVILALGMVLSIFIFVQARDHIQRQARAEFDVEVDRNADTMKRRMDRYHELVLALQGLMSSGESVSRESFHRFVSKLELTQRYAAVYFAFYSERVLFAERDKFLRAVRWDTSIDPGGYPDFSIKPPGDRPEYLVVKYVEPAVPNMSAMGADYIIRDTVREAVNRSRDSGQMTATGDFEFSFLPARPLGFALRAPLYRKGPPPQTVEERRAASVGAVGVTFRLADLINDLVRDFPVQRLHLQIFEGKPGQRDKPVYDSAPAKLLAGSEIAADDQGVIERRVSLVLADRQWELRFKPDTTMVSSVDIWVPWALLTGGLLTSALLFMLILSMATARARAEHVALEMTRDLREGEQRFRTLAELSSDWSWEQDSDFRFTSLSSTFQNRSGVAPERLLGKRRWDNFPDAETNPFWQQHRRTLEAHLPFRELQFVVDDTAGKPRWFTVNGNPVFDADGNFTGYRGTGREITRRKQTEIELEKSLSVLRATLESTADAILVVDENGEAIGYNRKFVGLWKMPDSLMMPDAKADRIAVEAAQLRDGKDFSERIAEIYQRPEAESFDVIRFLDGRVCERYSQPQKIGGQSVGRVWSFRDVTQRTHAERRLDMQHAVARLLAGSQSTSEVMSGIIRAICETQEWMCGAYWSQQPDGSLKCDETWHVKSEAIEKFTQASRLQTFDTGTVGMIRRAAAVGKPVWKADVASDPNFNRVELAKAADLHGAFAFPVLDRSKVLGVVEFYSNEIRQPDETLIDVTGAIGSQIGQFLRRKLAEDDLQFIAGHDALTKLPNRNLLNQRLDHALAQAKRHHKQVGIMFIDLDRFKTINDSQGHAAGDAALKEVAVRLQTCLRESDTIARQGGDEFVILIEEIGSPQYFVAVAEKILAALAKPFVLNGVEYHLGASIGISTYPGDCEDAESLLKNADIAMYRAKELGRNNFQFHSAQMNSHSMERLKLESSLRRAVERNQLVLHYQPKVDTLSGKINGVEALLRWQHPERGLVPPFEFISIAEETGLILPIGEWVLRTACERLRSWIAEGYPSIRMAVNISPRQFTNPGLSNEVARALMDTNLDPGLLELEITESMVMHNAEQAVSLLKQFKSMGICLSIDDFGTGYSSLSHLKRFPIDSLKIDRSFVKDIPGDADDSAITRAIVAMAQSLKLKTIAEGVETKEQFEFLKLHGCDEIQGYLFSKPVEESALLVLLKAPPFT